MTAPNPESENLPGASVLEPTSSKPTSRISARVVDSSQYG
jgi:hypothetical protein